MAAGALSITSARKQVVDFTRPFMTAGVAGVFKRTPASAGMIGSFPLDLADRMDLHFGLIPGSLTYHYFRTSNDTQVKRLWHRITTEDPPRYEWSSDSGITHVRNSTGDYVFFVESLFAEYQVTKPPCNLLLLDNLVNLSEYAFAVGRGSSLKRKISRALEALEGKGIIQKLKEKWWNQSCKRKTTKKPRKQKVPATSQVFITGQPTLSLPLDGTNSNAPSTSTSAEVYAGPSAKLPNSTAIFFTTISDANSAQTEKPYRPRKEASGHLHGDVTTWRPWIRLLIVSQCFVLIVLNLYN